MEGNIQRFTSTSSSSSRAGSSRTSSGGSRHSNLTSPFLQPAAFTTDKISDKLFSKNSLRWITAANIREKERLIHMFRSIDKAIHNTNLEIEYHKKTINRQRAQLRQKRRQKSHLEQLEEEKKKRIAQENRRRRARTLSAVEIESAIQAASAVAAAEDETEYLEVIGKGGKFFRVYPEPATDGFEVVREPQNDIYIPPVIVAAPQKIPVTKATKVRFAPEVHRFVSEEMSPTDMAEGRDSRTRTCGESPQSPSGTKTPLRQSVDLDRQSPGGTNTPLHAESPSGNKTPVLAQSPCDVNSPQSPSGSKSPQSTGDSATPLLKRDSSSVMRTPLLTQSPGGILIRTPRESPGDFNLRQTQSPGGTKIPVIVEEMSSPIKSPSDGTVSLTPDGEGPVVMNKLSVLSRFHARRGVVDVQDLRRLITKMQQRETLNVGEEAEAFTEDEKKVCNFLQKNSQLSQEYQQIVTASRYRLGASAVHGHQNKEQALKVYTERAIRRLSAAVGDMSLLREEEEAKRQRHLARKKQLDRIYHMPKIMPPVYQTKSRPLEYRDLDWEEPTPRPPPLTEFTWDELKCCRYIR